MSGRSGVGGRVLTVVACVGLLVAAGCQHSAAPSAEQPGATGPGGSGASSAGSSKDATAPVETPQATVTTAVTLKPVTREEYDQVLASLQGKVVLVDFWATWCVPCVEQFPHTLEMAEKYRANEVAVISLSCDNPEQRSQVEAFLRKRNATIENLLTTLDITATFDGFDIRGGIPFYKLYDRTGKLRYEFNGAPRPEDHTEPIEQLEVRLRELIDEPTPDRS